MKDVLSRLASGVTVVTTLCDGTPHGATVTAFTPVSLEPALVLVCLGQATDSLPLIERSQRFAVNILSRENAHFGGVFAGKGDPFGSFSWETAVTGSPILPGSLAWLDCTVSRCIPSGDHTIVLGAVERAAVGVDGDPLLYWSRAFRGLHAAPVVP